MARRGPARRCRPAGAVAALRTVLVTAVVMVVTTVLVAGCTGGGSQPPGPDSAPAVALRVTTVRGDGLDAAGRARLESEVGDVIARYVRAGFLGDYPRGGFVQSFADFTSGAAEQAVGDIDVLTAARFGNARSVRATDLGAALSFYVVHGEAVGATAWIDFAFAVDDRGTTTTAALGGRLVLDRGDDGWSVFGYDVHRDDSDALPTEASTP